MVLDSTAILSALDARDPRYAEAKALLAADPHVVHMIHMAEVSSVLHRKLPDGAAEILDLLESAPELTVSSSRVDRDAGRLHAKRPSPKVSLADCLGVALALKLGVPLATCDSDLLAYRSEGLAVRFLKA